MERITENRALLTARFGRIGLVDLIHASIRLGNASIRLPLTRELQAWKAFLRDAEQYVDVLKLPVAYDRYSTVYLVTSKPLAISLLRRDFDAVTMSRGEKEFFSAFQGSMIFAKTDREEWKRARKCLAPHLSPSGIHRYEADIRRVVQVRTKELVREIADFGVPSSKAFRRFVAHVLFNLYLGIEAKEHQVNDLVSSFGDFYRYAPVIVLGFDKLKVVRDFIHSRLNGYDRVIESILRESPTDYNKGIFLDFLKMNPSQDVTDCFHTMFAGQSSLATSLEWITYRLAINPQLVVQLKRRMSESTASLNLRPLLEDTARRFPTATFLLREVKCMIPSYNDLIRENSLVIVPLFGIGANETSNNELDMYNLQFSPGIRRCMGRNIAEYIHTEYVRTLLNNCSEIACQNRPRQIIGTTTVRPEKEFEFILR